jgi:hypothetical protein
MSRSACLIAIIVPLPGHLPRMPAKPTERSAGCSRCGGPVSPEGRAGTTCPVVAESSAGTWCLLSAGLVPTWCRLSPDLVPTWSLAGLRPRAAIPCSCESPRTIQPCALLDHVVIFSEAHARRLLADYCRYYHQDRCHLGLDKDCPDPRPVQPRPPGNANVVALSRVGGLHHRYEWKQAA